MPPSSQPSPPSAPLMSRVLDTAFFRRTDTAAIARELLGQYLFARGTDGQLAGGRIVETEAYAGENDRANHGAGGRRTPRTEVMFEAGGVVYMYVCYGIHHMLNLVTGPAGRSDAVLIRALEPTHNTSILQARRSRKLTRELAGGPGRLTHALAIDRSYNRLPLPSEHLWLEAAPTPADNSILAGPRVGIDYAGADAELPYRFRIADSPWTSPASGRPA